MISLDQRYKFEVNQSDRIKMLMYVHVMLYVELKLTVVYEAHYLEWTVAV